MTNTPEALYVNTKKQIIRIHKICIGLALKIANTYLLSLSHTLSLNFSLHRSRFFGAAPAPAPAPATTTGTGDNHRRSNSSSLNCRLHFSLSLTHTQIKFVSLGPWVVYCCYNSSWAYQLHSLQIGIRFQLLGGIKFQFFFSPKKESRKNPVATGVNLV